MTGLLTELGAWSPLELTAAVLALLYLVLAARQSLWCWPAAFISTMIYFGLFLERRIYQQALLQVFYLSMAVYGFVHWRRAQGEQPLAISTWRAGWHLRAAAGIAALTVVSGWLEARYTAAPLPFLDAFTTWGAVVTTWMVARKVLENWLYWLVVDGASLYLYWATGLPATTLLFAVYLGIVIAGYLNWRRAMHATPARMG